MQCDIGIKAQMTTSGMLLSSILWKLETYFQDPVDPRYVNDT